MHGSVGSVEAMRRLMETEVNIKAVNEVNVKNMH